MRMQTPCPANQRHKMAPASSWPLLRHTARMVSYGAEQEIVHSGGLGEHLARPRSAYAWSSFMYTLVGLQSLLLWTPCPAAVSEWPQRIARPGGSGHTARHLVLLLRCPVRGPLLVFPHC